MVSNTTKSQKTITSNPGSRHSTTATVSIFDLYADLQIGRSNGSRRAGRWRVRQYGGCHPCRSCSLPYQETDWNDAILDVQSRTAQYQLCLRSSRQSDASTFEPFSPQGQGCKTGVVPSPDFLSELSLFVPTFGWIWLLKLLRPVALGIEGKVSFLTLY